MAGGKISNDSLFLGLTRPSMLFGVTYKYAALNGLASLLAFVITSNFVYLLVLMPFLHGVAYLICLKEPLMIELLVVKAQKANKCPNKMYYNGANSYDLY